MADRSTWVEVDLSAIQTNLRATSRLTGTRIMAVVKANAYGHGALAVAQAAAEAGADWFAVARGEEALDLRKGGIQQPILIYGHIEHDDLSPLIKEAASVTIWEARQLEQVAAAAQAAGAPAKVHLKVDTGMSRLGVAPEQASGLAQRIVEQEWLRLEGVYSHLARADEMDLHPTEAQLATFDQLVGSLPVRPTLVHIANSAGGLRLAQGRYDLIRLGIALYGLHPSDGTQLTPDFQPALTWKSRLLRVKELEAGQGVSYGHEYITQKKERIGTVAVGYADGFRRTAGNEMLVAGKRVPVVGRVCMDLCMVQLDEAPQAEPGDEAVLIGRLGEEHISAEQVARRWHTINYEVTCGIGARVPRRYGVQLRKDMSAQRRRDSAA